MLAEDPITPSIRETIGYPAPDLRNRLLLVLSGNMLLDAVEVSAMLVAAPAVAGDLDLPPSSAHWLVTAFALGFGGMLPFGNALVGRFGRRRVYLAAMAVFAVASLGASLVSSLEVFAAVRAVKGACVAVTAPTGLAIIAATWPEGPPRRRAMRTYGIVGGTGFALGLLLSGLFATLDWRAVMVFPAPVAALLLGLAAQTLPRQLPGQSAVDPSEWRWAVLTRPALLRSATCAAALNGPYWGGLFLLTVELQDGRGYAPLRAALALLPASLPLALSWWLVPPLERRFSSGQLVAAGAALSCLGYLLLLPQLGGRSYVAGVLPSLLLVGAGFVLGFSALHLQATAGLAGPVLAWAGTAYQTAVQLGGAATLAGAAAASFDSASADSPAPALVVICVVSAAGAVVALMPLVPHIFRSVN